MKLNFTGKNIDVTDALREVTEKKLSKIDKYFEGPIDGKVVYIVEGDREIVEITIYLPGTMIRAEESSEDMYASIDLAVDVLQGQIRKHKTKLQNRYRDGGTIRFEKIEPEKKEDEGPKIVRTKRFDMKPMMEEEAILQMELLGHLFFMFLNDRTGELNVLYKRKDGNYALIEPEF